MNAAAWLLEGGAGRPDAAAFVVQGETTTHRDFRARTLAQATRFAANGVRPGDRVVLLGANSVDLAAAFLAAIHLGATAIPLPPTENEARLRSIALRTKPATIFAGPKQAAVATAIGSGAAVVGPALDTPDAPPQAAAAVTPEQPALVLFTSGSTGAPRGVVLSHDNLVANTSSILASLPIRETDRMMAVLPFYYSFGASVLFTHLRAGAAIVINNQFMFPDRVLAEMIREECTSFAGVPSTYQLLLRRSSLSKMHFPHLRYVQQAGGRLAPTFVKELGTALPATAIWLMYGQTEATARISCLDPKRLADKSHTIGKAIPGTTLSVVKEDGSAAAPGERGELVARGRSIALGYLDEPEATAETFKDGALRTGDIGYVDDEGFFVLVDRAKDFLKCAGYRVAIKEIEDVLLGFPGVVEAAVVGVPDELQGEAVKAFLVHPDGEAARAAFVAFATRALLPHLQPKVVVFLEALPKTPAGKLARSALKERA